MNLESLSQSFEKLNKLLPALGLIFSTLILLVGWVFYDINPLHMIKRIEAEQKGFDYAEQQRQFQRTVVENHLSLGYAFLDDRLYSQATSEFDKALGIDKLNEAAQIGRFIVEVADQIQNDFRPQAIERQLHFLQQQQPDNPYVQVLYGDLAVQLDDNKKAIDYYDRATQSERQPASAYFGLGYLFENQPQPQLDHALKYYQKAVERSEWNQIYLNNLATVNRKLGHYQESIKQYEKILTLDRDYMLPNLGISQSYALSGKFSMAINYQKQLIMLMDQPSIADQAKNKSPWNFHNTLLESMDEKRQYVLFSLGLSFFLLDQKDDAQNYLQKARAIKTDITAEIKAIVAQDIELLVKKNTLYETQAEQFKQQYLK